MQPFDPLQLYLPLFEKRHVQTAGHEVAHHAGDKDLAAKRVARDACCVVHGGAEELVGFVKGVAGVDSDPDAYGWRLIGERVANLELDRLGASNGAAGTREG